MTEYVLSHDAEIDLLEALDFMESRSEKAALHLEHRLLDAFQYLSDWPSTGHARPDSPDAGLRFWNVEGFVIVYDPDSVPLNIHAIVHGSRDFAAAFIIR